MRYKSAGQRTPDVQGVTVQEAHTGLVVVAVPFLGGSSESLEFSIQISNAETGEVITEMEPTVLCPDRTERRDRKLRLKTIYKFIGFIYQNTIPTTKKKRKEMLQYESKEILTELCSKKYINHS